VIDGTPGDGDGPGRIDFKTVPDGGTSLTTRMTIDNTGTVSIDDSNYTMSVTSACFHNPAHHTDRISIRSLTGDLNGDTPIYVGELVYHTNSAVLFYSTGTSAAQYATSYDATVGPGDLDW